MANSIGSTVFFTLKNNSDLGAFTPLEEDQILQIFSRVQGIARNGSVPLVCKTFHYVMQNPGIAYFVLEQQLKILEKQLKRITTLTYTELEPYYIPFRQRYGTDFPLSKIFASCPRLTTLDFSNAYIDDLFLEKVLESAKDCPNLKALALRNCEGLTKIVNLNRLKFLQNLDLAGCTRLSSELDFDGLDQLECLLLVECSDVTRLLNLNGLKSLRILNLAHCVGLTGRLCLNGLPRLETLNICNCPRLTGIDLGGSANTVKIIQ